MPHRIQDIFEAFSLNASEQKVFEALLGRGAQPASRIARVLSIPRNTARNILDRLVEIGLLARRKKINANYYRVESSTALERSIKQRHHSHVALLKKQLKVLQQAKPLLDAQIESSNKPNITFYEGLDGVKRVYEDTLSAKETIRSWASFEANSKALPEYFKLYYKRRARKKIPIRSIHPDTEFARRHAKKNKRELRECFLVSQEQFSISPEIQVYDNKVNMVSWEDKLGLIIESDALARAMKNIFDLCFALADKNQQANFTSRDRGRGSHASKEFK